MSIVRPAGDSIAADEADLPITAAQREELDRRLDAYQRGPDEGAMWEEVKARIQGKK